MNWRLERRVKWNRLNNIVEELFAKIQHPLFRKKATVHARTSFIDQVIAAPEPHACLTSPGSNEITPIAFSDLALPLFA